MMTTSIDLFVNFMILRTIIEIVISMQSITTQTTINMPLIISSSLQYWSISMSDKALIGHISNKITYVFAIY